MNKLGIHESELNTTIKEKRCWHPAHSHHTFSERVLQWGSACTPLGRALPPHGLQRPSLGGHADTPNIPEGKRDGARATRAPASQQDGHTGENLHPPETSGWRGTQNRKGNEGDKADTTERPRSPHARWASGKRTEQRLRDQLTVAQAGLSPHAGKQVCRRPEGGSRTKHWRQAKQDAGVMEFLTSAQLPVVVLIWLQDLINPQHHKDLWSPRPDRFSKNQELNNHFQNVKTTHCKMCFRKMSVSKNSFCLPKRIIQNFQAIASSELPLLMWIETMIKIGIFQNPKFQTHPVHFQPTVQKSAAWIQNVTEHLDMTSTKIHKFCSDQHFNCYLCHSTVFFFF